MIFYNSSVAIIDLSHLLDPWLSVAISFWMSPGRPADRRVTELSDTGSARWASTLCNTI
jgi:hypothetical protein